MKRIVLPLAVIMSLSFTACEDAGNRDGGDGDTSELRDMSDGMQGDIRDYRQEDFVTDVIEANAEELAWIREGLSKGTDAELKQHAQHMLADHEKMRTDLLAYAQKHNYDLTGLDTNRTVNNNKSAGANWDEEWADEMVDMHRSTIRRFERAQKRIQEQELAGMITSTLPTLRSHLQMMEGLDNKLDK